MENGPISFVGNTSTPGRNPHSWTTLGHVLYVDQPAGTGFSTTSYPYPVTTNERITSDFYSWLKEFYRNFPHLLHKRLHIIGESYAGIYIPYIASEIVERQQELPVNLSSIAIGDAVFGNNAAMAAVTAVTYMQSQQAELEIPQDIMGAFNFGNHVCRFDSVVNRASIYPPRYTIEIPGDPEHLNFKRGVSDMALSLRSADTDSGSCNISPNTSDKAISSVLNSPCYGPCATFSTAADYLQMTKPCFNLYNIRYDCNIDNPIPHFTAYLNRADVQAALHIHPEPSNAKSMNHTHRFEQCNSTILDTLSPSHNHPTPPAYHILPDLLTNHKLPVHVYQGKLDMLINHIGVELVLQNMTWNGMQGFQQRPHLEFRGEDGKVAGIWAEERGLSYHLFNEAGHVLPRDLPAEMLSYVRDVVVGNRDS